jgi:hypothetical protein
MSDPLDTLSLEVEAEGRVHLPPAVVESLGLESADLLSLTTRNAISVRLDPYKYLVEDLRRSVQQPQQWCYHEQFLQRTLTSLGSDGSAAIPPEVLRLTPGDLLTLEVVTEGLRRALYIYRADA